jgi:hypothetical protein
MSWNIEKPGDRINGPLTITGNTTLTGTATISGDLTVDTSTLKVDATNNRVGIGTASPANKLEVQNSSDADILIKSTGANAALILDYADSYGFSVLRKAGNQTWSYGVIGDSSASAPFVFRYSSSNLMTLSSGGNLGLGVVPKSWLSNTKALEVGSSGSSIFSGSGLSNTVYITQNSYNDGSWKYANTGTAALYGLNSDGSFAWYKASSGTAGNGISWTQSMTLDASGNLGVGAATPAAKLDVATTTGFTWAASPAAGAHIGTRGTAGGSLMVQTASLNANYGSGLAVDGTYNSGKSTINLKAFGVYSGGPYSSDIAFFTSTETTLSEKMRLDNAGVLLLKTNGTASAPTIANADNPDTGLYWPNDNDTLALAVGGSDAVYIDSSRNVLIGASSFATTTKFNVSSNKLNANYPINCNIQSKDQGLGEGGSIGFTGFNAGGFESFMGAVQSVFESSGTTVNDYKAGLRFLVRAESTGSLTERLRISSTGQALFSTNGTASAPTIANADNPDTGLYWPTDADTLALAVGGSDAIYIDAGRKVGIGTSTPTGKLHVVHTAGQAAALLQGGHLEFYKDATPTAAASIGLGGPASGSTNDIVFNTYGGTWAERLRINASGNLLVGVTSANANGGVLQLKSGITFPATQVASSDPNTLDDYEEGTWTPTLTFDTPGTLSVNYAARVGKYTKVGNVVTVTLYLLLNPGSLVKGTASGVLKVTGLPFANSGYNSQYMDFAASISDLNTGSLCFASVQTDHLYFEALGVSGSRVVRDFAGVFASNFAASNTGYISFTRTFSYFV